MTKSELDKAFFLARKSAPYALKALAAVRVVWTDKCLSNGTPTMACDKHWRVYIHPDLQVSPEEAAWILLHEVLGHLVRQHHAQCQKIGANPTLANIAMDCEIESWNWPSLKRPDWGITPAKFELPAGKLWGWYYEKLQQHQSNHQQFHASSAADGIPRSYELSPDDEQAPALRPELAEAITQAVAEEIKKIGDAPASLQVWADAVLAPPKRNWRNALRMFISQHTRRGMHDKTGVFRVHRTSGLLVPSWNTNLPHVVVVADTSGSMSSEGGKVLSEIVGILGASYRTDVVWCDTEPVLQKTVRRHTLKPIGGGGTDLRPAIDMAQELNPDVMIIITDCETPWPKEPIKNALVVCASHTAPPQGWRYVNL